MAQVSKPQGITDVWAAIGDKVAPPDGKIAEGWVRETPPLQYFNWLDNKQDQALAHINQRGIMSWDAETEYYALTSYAQGQTNGLLYRCLQNNSNVNPELDTTGETWEVAFAITNSPTFTGTPRAPTPNITDNSTRIATTAYVREALTEIAQAPPVRTPINLTPTDVSQAVSSTAVLTSSTYYSLYGVAHSATQFRVATDPNFTNVVRNVTLGAVTTWTITPALSANTVYFWQVRYKDAENVWSDWSIPFQFNTGNAYLNTPTFTSPTNGEINVDKSPTFVASAFAVTNGSDTHQSTDWELRTGPSGSGLVKFSSYNNTVQKTSLNIQSIDPNFKLEQNTTYYMRVRYQGVAFGLSAWGEVSFTTKVNFYPTVIGEAYAGGYYAGVIKVGTKRFALIVSPKNGGEIIYTNWTQAVQNSTTGAGGTILTPYGKLAFRDTPYSRGAASYSDGKANTDILTFGHDAFPATSYFPIIASLKSINQAGLNGYSDWYIPSKDELEILYRFFKPTTASNLTSATTGLPYNLPMGYNANSEPTNSGYTIGNPTRTALTPWIQGGTEAFTGVYSGNFNLPEYLYLTSTVEVSPSAEESPLFAYRQAFTNGEQNNGAGNLSANGANAGFTARIVRRVEII